MLINFRVKSIMLPTSVIFTLWKCYLSIIANTGPFPQHPHICNISPYIAFVPHTYCLKPRSILYIQRMVLGLSVIQSIQTIYM